MSLEHFMTLVSSFTCGIIFSLDVDRGVTVEAARPSLIHIHVATILHWPHTPWARGWF